MNKETTFSPNRKKSENRIRTETIRKKYKIRNVDYWTVTECLKRIARISRNAVNLGFDLSLGLWKS